MRSASDPGNNRGNLIRRSAVLDGGWTAMVWREMKCGAGVNYGEVDSGRVKGDCGN